MRLYAGCMVSSRLPFIEAAAGYVFKKIGLDVPTVKDAPCCMDPIGLGSADRKAFDDVMGIIRQKSENDSLVTLCDGCSLSFSKAGIDTKDFIQIVTENIDCVKNNIVSPVNMKLAVFPGCHCEAVCKSKGTDAYDAMSKILETAGAVPLIPEKNLCCGGSVSGIDDPLAKRIMDESVNAFKSTGAGAVAVSCPFCFMQFDVFARYRTYHIAEILAHAMGWSEDTQKYHRGN